MKYIQNGNLFGPFLNGRAYSEGFAFNEGEARWVSVANHNGGVGEQLVGVFYYASMTNGILELGQKVTKEENKEKMAKAKEICLRTGWKYLA
jgi:hypothetical protein